MASEQIELNVVVGGIGSLRDVSVALRSLTMAMDQNVRSVRNMDARQRALNQALGVTTKGVGEHAKNLGQAVRNQSTLSNAIRETTRDLTRLRSELAMGRGGPGMPNLVRDLEAAQRNMQRLRPRALISDLRSVSLQIRKMGKDLQFVGRSLIIGLTTPILGFANKGLSAMYSLEKQLVKVRKIIGQVAATNVMTEQEIQGFRNFGYEIDQSTQRLDGINKVLRDTSMTLGISRDALTAITADFAVLGVTAGDTLARLTKTAAEVSLLGSMDLDASQELTQTLFLGMQRALDKRGELFESAAEKQARATDLLRSQIYLFNAVENATSMSFKDIAQSLPEIAAAVTEFGLSFMEGIALTAPIKAAGIQTSVAANAIKMSMQRLTAPTITAQKHMEGLKNEMQDIINESPTLQTAFENIFGIGSVGLQALIDITQAVGDMEDGSAKAMAMYSRLFDKRQSTRMKIAIDDMAAFQREMNRGETGAAKLINQFNEWSQAAAASNNTTLPLIKTVKDLSEVAKIASANILPGEAGVEIAGRLYFQEQIDAAREARALLQQEFREQFALGNNIIKDISQESGKVMFTQLLGAGGAVELAQAELKVAQESIAVTIDRIKISLKEITITFISDMKPVLESIASAMSRLSKAFENMDPAVRKSITGFAAFVAAIGPMVFILGQVKLATGVLAGTILRFLPGLRNLSVEQVAANSGLRRLRRGLTMTGDSVTNTNTRFVTLIASLAGGSGIVGRLADRFGRLTGMIRKTQTVSGDVQSAITRIAPTGQRAIDLLNVSTPAPFRSKTFLDDAARDQLRQQSAARNLARRQAIAARANQQTFQTAGITAMGLGGFAQRPRGARHMQKLSSAARGAVEAATEEDRQSRLLALRRRRMFKARGIIEDRDSGRFMAQRRFGRGLREISQERAEIMTAGSLRERIGLRARTARGAIGAVGRAPGAAVRGVAALPGVLKTGGIKAYTKTIGGARQAVNELIQNKIDMGRAAPGIFARMAAGVRGFSGGLLSATKMVNLLKIALIKTGIGAIIIGLVAIIAIFVKNWDDVKEKAQPVLEALKEGFEALKRIGTALLAPFVEFFNALGGGGEESAGAVAAIGSVMEWVAGAITKVSEAVESFVNEKVVPFFRLALGAALTYAEGIKGLVSAFIQMFKGGDDATQKLRESFNTAFTGILQLVLGVVAPALIEIISMAIKTIIKLFFTLVAKMPLVAGMIVNVFLQLGAAIVDILGKAFLKILGPLGRFGPIRGAIEHLVSGFTALTRGAGSAAGSIGKSITDYISDPLKNAGDAASNFVDGIAKTGKDWVREFRPLGTESANGFWGGFKKRSEDKAITVTEDIMDPMVDASGSAGEDAAKAFAQEFENTMQGLQQRFVDLVLGVLDTTIKDVTNDLVNALDRQREAALEVFDQQLETIDKLQKAEESLTRQKEYLANRRRLIDERELNRQNYIRNRALAIYEGRIDDARMLDLEERKSRSDSARSIQDLDDKRNRDLARENIEFIKDQIKKTKAESDKFFKEQIEAFKKAATEITKFAPQTIEEYENQLNQLTELAKKTANENGDAFAETFEKMSEAIQTQLPNIGAGVFTENLQTLIDIAREKYGLDSPSSNSIVGATVEMLRGVSQSIQTDGLIINNSMSGVLKSLKDDVVDKTLNEINVILEENNPHTIIARAIEFANQTIIREFQRTVGHVASNVDDLAKSMDPFIEKIVRAQIELQKLRDAANAAGAGGSGSPLDPRAFTIPKEAIPAWQMTTSSPEDFLREWEESQKRLDAAEAARKAAADLSRLPDHLTLGPEQMRRVAGVSFTNTLPPIPSMDTSLQLVNREFGLNSEQKSLLDRVKGLFQGSLSLGFQYGGKVPGFASQGVPALLHGGEFVVNSKAVSNIGLAALQSMNNMRFSTPRGYEGSNSSTQITETHNYNIYVDNFIGEDQWFEGMMKNYNMKVVPRNQKNAGLQSRTVSTYSGINRGM